MRHALTWLLATTMLGQAAPKVHRVSQQDVTSSDIIVVVKQTKSGRFEIGEVVRGNADFLTLFLHLLNRLEFAKGSRERQFLYLNREGRDPLDPLKVGRVPEITGGKYVPSQSGQWFLWRNVVEGRKDW
ncbi:hypothetical protein OKA05_27825 [Luteolibacter arcticus]|uniref:Doublecortin domain-containing protein n=1 Tax=Luteolibacter arcticus TaxID=1581411 RepID=A0ABT3GSC9_9BACT|nr:hypothetical protein [Luteolibacter arcticus]MCW1926392.1 hypothetical protein [Luteolibacter arcticus]